MNHFGATETGDLCRWLFTEACSVRILGPIEHFETSPDGVNLRLAGILRSSIDNRIFRVLLITRFTALRALGSNSLPSRRKRPRPAAPLTATTRRPSTNPRDFTLNRALSVSWPLRVNEERSLAPRPFFDYFSSSISLSPFAVPATTQSASDFKRYICLTIVAGKCDLERRYIFLSSCISSESQPEASPQDHPPDVQKGIFLRTSLFRRRFFVSCCLNWLRD